MSPQQYIVTANAHYEGKLEVLVQQQNAIYFMPPDPDMPGGNVYIGNVWYANPEDAYAIRLEHHPQSKQTFNLDIQVVGNQKQGVLVTVRNIIQGLGLKNVQIPEPTPYVAPHLEDAL